MKFLTPKHNLIIIVFALIFLGVRAYAAEITVFPENYAAGQETLYLQGSANPGDMVTIRLYRDNSEIKSWPVKTDSQGEWSLKTRDLFPSGQYYLSLGGKTEPKTQKIGLKIVLSGFYFFGLAITYRFVNFYSAE